MKVAIYTDNHWTQHRSIVRGRGEKYSVSLENQIESINWVERLAAQEGCRHIFCLGDFFDKSTLTAEEITALKDIEWNKNAEHYFIVGNHEMGTNDLTYSSAHIFESLGFKVFKFVDLIKFNEDIAFIILPYLTKDRRATLEKYKADLTLYEKANKYIVLSHNDISGIRYGQYVSKDGFDIQDIYDNCDLFINGHLHNQTQINDKTINLGNLTGQNFSEDAEKYSHCVAILETDTLKLDLIVNPFALNFYKLEILSEDDFNQLDKCVGKAVLSIKVKEPLINNLKLKLATYQNIVEYRLITLVDVAIAETDTIQQITVTDHITQFKTYITQQLGLTDTVVEELSLLE